MTELSLNSTRTRTRAQILLYEYQLSQRAICRENALHATAIQRVLDPEACRAMRHADVLRLRTIIERALRAAGWKGNPEEDLWAEYDSSYLKEAAA